MEVCRKVGCGQGVDKTLEENNLNLVALHMDSPAPRIAAAASQMHISRRWVHTSMRWGRTFALMGLHRHQIATVPLGILDQNGRPFGLAIIAKGDRDDLLFSFMSAFEAVSPPRPVPPRLTA